MRPAFFYAPRAFGAQRLCAPSARRILRLVRSWGFSTTVQFCDILGDHRLATPVRSRPHSVLLRRAHTSCSSPSAFSLPPSSPWTDGGLLSLLERGRCSLAGPSAACCCCARAVLCAVLCVGPLLLRCCRAGAAVACACAPLLLVCTVSVVRRLRKPAGRLVFGGIRISTAGGRCLGLVLRGAGSVSGYYARHASSVRSVHSVPTSAPKSIRQRHRRPGSSTVIFIAPPRASAIKG